MRSSRSLLSPTSTTTAATAAESATASSASCLWCAAPAPAAARYPGPGTGLLTLLASCVLLLAHRVNHRVRYSAVLDRASADVAFWLLPKLFPALNHFRSVPNW